MSVKRLCAERRDSQQYRSFRFDHFARPGACRAAKQLCVRGAAVHAMLETATVEAW